MDKLYIILNNIQILFQFLLWILVFFWHDFDLFTYILNNYYPIKLIFGIIMITFQIYLFQYLYNLIAVDSIYNS